MIRFYIWLFLFLTEHQEEKHKQTRDEHIPEVHSLPHEGEGESCPWSLPSQTSLWCTL